MGIRLIQKNINPQTVDQAYVAFDQLNGNHPWMNILPTGYVPYRVRELRMGEITYFNFVLAKEMGLISSDHPHKLTPTLKAKLIETFSLQIINEYDEISKRRVDPSTVKPNKYMASRYLQLQHANKQGKTSGDGRGIWNGVVECKGKIWDVSSRGTGVTRLAPGSVEARRPLKTGKGDFGYGCGQAEIDELYAAAIMAEIIHLQGIKTERVLAIIDLGKGYGIGVRAGLNLIRPAHLFMYLKQNRLDELKAGVDYFIQRQIKNLSWSNFQKSKNKYIDMAEELCKEFAKFTATLDIDYVFAWLDWDGDNVLAHGGIIDYGSVRQFGIRHDHYRYDDVERFSTNLNEQRLKARLIVQAFTQISDFITTGKKKPLKDFAHHPVVEKFNNYFKIFRSDRLLYRMGFNEKQRNHILNTNPKLFELFDKEFSYFERAKISGNSKKVPDGINHPPLFNMRRILRELPEYYSQVEFEKNIIASEIFFKKIISSFAKQRDARMKNKHVQHIYNFQKLYKELVVLAADKQKPQQILRDIAERAIFLNREDRITGNGLIQIVDEILTEVKKGMSLQEIQGVIDQIIFAHLRMPEIYNSKFYPNKPRLIVRPDLYSKILNLVIENKEQI